MSPYTVLCTSKVSCVKYDLLKLLIFFSLFSPGFVECTHVCACMCMCLYMQVCVRVHLYMCMHIFVVYVCMCVHVCALCVWWACEVLICVWHLITFSAGPVVGLRENNCLSVARKQAFHCHGNRKVAYGETAHSCNC